MDIIPEWNGRNKLFLFKESVVHTSEEQQRGPHGRYPKGIAAWSGMQS